MPTELEYLLLAALTIADVAVDLAPVSPIVLMSVVMTLAVRVVQLILRPVAASEKTAEVPALSDPLRVLEPDDVMLRALDMDGTAASPTARIAAVSRSFFML